MREPDSGLAARIQQETPISLDTSIACPPDEVLALVGPSGSGKSTVLRCIAGLNRPTRGRIVCRGEVWLDTEKGVRVAPRHRRVGMVFQSYALFPHLTAIENVMEALGDRSRATRRGEARRLLDLVHLAGLEERKPGALSGGQQQRVAVARALARDPEVLLLDEPFSAVDKATRQKLYRELAELRQKLRMPVVLVTHDLDEAILLADRLCILHRGRTLQEGAPFEILARPASVDVARLIDLRNVFEGRVIEHRASAGITRVSWGPYVLEAKYQPAFAEGETVAWAIQTAKVILHRRDRPSRGDRENPIGGGVEEFIPLGETASVAMKVDGIPELPLFMSIPLHVAARNRIALGERVTVSLLAEGIHLMPPDTGAGGA